MILNLRKYKPDDLRSDGHQPEALALRPTPLQLMLRTVCPSEPLFFDAVKLLTRVQSGVTPRPLRSTTPIHEFCPHWGLAWLQG
jgi:hypothetical protein